MARDGGGVYTLPVGSTVANGETSDATDLNTPFDDLETDANTARPIVAGGTGGVTAAAARTNLDIETGLPFIIHTGAGSSGAHTITTSRSISAYSTGMSFRFRPNHTTGTANTLNVDSVGAVNMKVYEFAGTLRNFTNYDFSANDIVTAIYDGTQFICSTERAGVASTTSRGPVQGATAAELLAGTAFKWPDADIIQAQQGLWMIESQDASADASLNFTGFDNSIWDAYQFEFANLLPSSDGAGLRIRTSTDGGSTYASGASTYTNRLITTTTSSSVYSSTDNASVVTDAVGSDTNEQGVSGSLTLQGAGLAVRTMWQWQASGWASAGTLALWQGATARLEAADIDALQFYYSVGNITSGTITMYGLKS